jgi:hypothetical protein
VAQVRKVDGARKGSRQREEARLGLPWPMELRLLRWKRREEMSDQTCRLHVMVVNGVRIVPYLYFRPNKRWNYSIPLTKHIV